MSCNVNCSGNQLFFCSKIVVTAWVADIGLACVAFSRGGTIEQRAEAKTALSQSFGRHRWHLAPNRENNFLNRGHLSRTFMWHFSYHTKEGKIKEKWLLVEHLLNYSIKLPLKLEIKSQKFFWEYWRNGCCASFGCLNRRRLGCSWRQIICRAHSYMIKSWKIHLWIFNSIAASDPLPPFPSVNQADKSFFCNALF